MKPAVFRLRFWHRWLGLAALLPLILMAITGSILAYKKPLIQLLVTQQAALPSDYSLATLSDELNQIALLANLQQAARVKAPNAQEPYWTLTDKHQHHQLYRIGSLTPYQDNLMVLTGFSYLHHLHTKLLLDKAGQVILLISGIFALVLIFTGIWLWWPGRRGFRWRFSKPGAVPQKTALQLHRHSGIVAAPMLIIITLTGAIMLWQKLVSPLLSSLPNKVISSQTHIQPINQFSNLDTGNSNVGSSVKQINAADALALAQQQQLENSWPTYIRFPQHEANFYRFRFRLTDEWHPNGRTSVNVDALTASITLSPRSDQVPWQYRLINQLYPLHSGYGINGIYQVLICIAGIYLFWLSITGLLSYIRQLKHRKK
ncbi:PepSY-associated TM helix domain-containing protein [Colwellia sp. MEBiC06753]